MSEIPHQWNIILSTSISIEINKEGVIHLFVVDSDCCNDGSVHFFCFFKNQTLKLEYKY